MGDPTREDVRDALYDELRIWLVDPLTAGDEATSEDFEQCVANVWAIVTDPDAGRALQAEAPPSIFGRDRVLVEGVAKKAHKALSQAYDHTDLAETRRGFAFEVHVTTSDGVRTGHVARITVDLARVVGDGTDG